MSQIMNINDWRLPGVLDMLLARRQVCVIISDNMFVLYVTKLDV
jgi:hypothetical protein